MVSFLMISFDNEGNIAVPVPSSEQLEQAIDSCSYQFELDVKLVRAIVEQESSGDCRLRRYEDGFFKKYINNRPKADLRCHWPKDISEATERRERATSWGPMQIMGQTARERGFKGNFADLLHPSAGVFWGCSELARLLKLTKGNIPAALLKWNGGGNPDYPDEVLARID